MDDNIIIFDEKDFGTFTNDSNRMEVSIVETEGEAPIVFFSGPLSKKLSNDQCVNIASIIMLADNSTKEVKVKVGLTR